VGPTVHLLRVGDDSPAAHSSASIINHRSRAEHAHTARQYPSCFLEHWAPVPMTAASSHMAWAASGRPALSVAHVGIVQPFRYGANHGRGAGAQNLCDDGTRSCCSASLFLACCQCTSRNSGCSPDAGVTDVKVDQGPRKARSACPSRRAYGWWVQEPQS